MTQNLPSATHKPRLDDLLATMGITHEQFMEMTADDLFDAAARWQDEVTIAAEAQHFASSADRPLDSLQGRSADLSSLN